MASHAHRLNTQMRLSFIEVEGFRGIRAHLRINVPDGFLIVTGRNGSGKSTICDAVEFALTGTVSKYVSGSERGESMEEYLWWRGQRAAARNLVRVGIRDATGREFVVTRTPGTFAVSDNQSLASTLCDIAVMPREPLAQLCRTAIIRDETVAAMSIDLAEESRFKFVRTALGTDSLDEVAGRGKEVLNAIKKEVQAAEAAYAKARSEVTTLVAELSRVRAMVAEVPDTSAAEEVIRGGLGDGSAVEPARLLAAARQRVAVTRQQNDTLLRLVAEAAILETQVQQLEERLAEESALKERQAQLAREMADATEIQRQHEERKAERQTWAPARAQLAALYEAGRTLGLREGGCPLCFTQQSAAQFAAALERVAEELEDTERAAASADREAAAVLEQVVATKKEMQSVAEELTRRRVAREELHRRRTLLVDQVRGFGVPVREKVEAEVVEEHVRQSQRELEHFVAAITVLEASEMVDQAAELERRLSHVQEQSAAAEAELRRREAAHARAKRLLTGVRRAIGEVEEERLAALDPLVKDLYSRLRPHSDWTDLSLAVRGEVRKFLSLSVGDDVNPRFTFSSGQRRAIGLAFLLAVHLSRPWCRLRTLLLDDPVQHIDDFRSLYLVEVLGAIRKMGQQIVCAVEDEELAELICRRVRSGREGDGLLMFMAYRSGDGAVLESARPIPAAVPDLVVPAGAGESGLVGA